jgi:hypothetical protein
VEQPARRLLGRWVLAAATLVLETPQLVTLEATGTNLRKLIVPAGTRYIEYSSAAAWFYEKETATPQSDGGAGTAAIQQRVDAGTSSFRAPGSGSGRACIPLGSTVAIYLAGSNSGQLWLTATRRAP